MVGEAERKREGGKERAGSGKVDEIWGEGWGNKGEGGVEGAVHGVTATRCQAALGTSVCSEIVVLFVQCRDDST